MLLATVILKQIKGHYSLHWKICYIYKKSRVTQELYFLDINILWNYKYHINLENQELSGNIQLSCVHPVFCKQDFQKAAALWNVPWIFIYQMCGHSFDSHYLQKIVGILLMVFSILLSTWQASFSMRKLSLATQCCVWCDTGKGWLVPTLQPWFLLAHQGSVLWCIEKNHLGGRFCLYSSGW